MFVSKFYLLNEKAMTIAFQISRPENRSQDPAPDEGVLITTACQLNK